MAAHLSLSCFLLTSTTVSVVQSQLTTLLTYGDSHYDWRSLDEIFSMLAAKIEALEWKLAADGERSLCQIVSISCAYQLLEIVQRNSSAQRWDNWS